MENKKQIIELSYDDLLSVKIFDEMRKLNDTKYIFIPENDGGIEMHKINNSYFLFTIHPWGGEPVFEGSFHHTTDIVQLARTLT